MAILDMEFRSDVLSLDTQVKIIMPHKGNSPSKVIYLLHGLCGNRNCWLRETDIFNLAENFTVIMPEVGRSFYTDTMNDQKYFTFIAEEIPAVMKKTLNISDKREDTFAMGYSMGGYGAVKLALRHPEKIRAAVSLSGVLGLGAGGKPPKSNEWAWVFGTEKLRPEDDVMELIDGLKNKEEKPDIFFCCGKEDFLYRGNIFFKEHLEKNGYPFTFEDFPGEHPQGYTNERIKRGIEFIKTFC
ncbi:MAG: alpha/beta fold hydrolase [Ruminococcaceae bacterium]|nr:alpha/beta fold hydrolase [Oscillospiraceae bacterium]